MKHVFNTRTQILQISSRLDLDATGKMEISNASGNGDRGWGGEKSDY